MTPGPYCQKTQDPVLTTRRHSDQVISPRRRYNTCKYLCTQHRSTKIHKILADIKGEIYNNMIIIEDCKTPPTSMDRSCRQKTNRETLALNNTLVQMYLIITYRTFPPKAAEYTSFSSAQGRFSRIDHMLGHKTNLIKFKKTNYIKHIFQPQHYEIRSQLQEKNCQKKPKA